MKWLRIHQAHTHVLDGSLLFPHVICTKNCRGDTLYRYICLQGICSGLGYAYANYEMCGLLHVGDAREITALTELDPCLPGPLPPVRW